MAEVHHVLKTRDCSAELGRWSLQGRFDWREWDDEFVVRVDVTGTTYLLSALAGRTIKALRDGAAHVEEIATHVSADSTPPSDATAALIASFAGIRSDTQGMLGVLQELEGLGLVQASLT